MHKCPTHMCERQVEDSKLMCLEHWRELPREDQRAVWESFDDNGPGHAHIIQISPILDRQRERLYPKRNQGRPFGL